MMKRDGCLTTIIYFFILLFLLGILAYLAISIFIFILVCIVIYELYILIKRKKDKGENNHTIPTLNEHKDNLFESQDDINLNKEDLDQQDLKKIILNNVKEADKMFDEVAKTMNKNYSRPSNNSNFILYSDNYDEMDDFGELYDYDDFDDFREF